MKISPHLLPFKNPLLTKNYIQYIKTYIEYNENMEIFSCFYIPKLSLADVNLAALYKSLYEYLKASIVCEKS